MVTETVRQVWELGRFDVRFGIGARGYAGRRWLNRTVPAPPEVPVAAPAPLHPLLTGPRRPASVLAALGPVTYLAADGEVLALGGRGALRLPFTVVAGTSDEPGTVPPGRQVTVGEGEIRAAGGVRYVVRRWWRPRRPRPLPGTRVVSRRVDRLAALLPSLPEPVDPSDLDPQRLVGLGPGLTPAGDDVLAGALVALEALAAADPGAGALRTDLREPTVALLHRTTDLSASLLRHAAAGRSLPQVVDVLDALGGHGDLRAAADRLVAVGSSSGTALGHGIVAASRWCSPDVVVVPPVEVA